MSVRRRPNSLLSPQLVKEFSAAVGTLSALTGQPPWLWRNVLRWRVQHFTDRSTGRVDVAKALGYRERPP